MENLLGNVVKNVSAKTAAETYFYWLLFGKTGYIGSTVTPSSNPLKKILDIPANFAYARHSLERDPNLTVLPDGLVLLRRPNVKDPILLLRRHPSQHHPHRCSITFLREPNQRNFQRSWLLLLVLLLFETALHTDLRSPVRHLHSDLGHQVLDCLQI